MNLKDLYTKEFIHDLADKARHHHRAFDKKSFIAGVLDRQWKSRELKNRMRHVTLQLHEQLPGDFRRSAGVIRALAPEFKEHEGHGLITMIFPDYIEMFGQDDPKTALPALAELTQHSTAEFAIRPFILRDPAATMKQMRKWADDDNHHIRRLSSEGCRPRLPWACALPAFKRDPAPILPILEALKKDDSDYVRKSVANNINDISKDNPGIALKLAQKWHGSHRHTDWIVKHACRTLLKQGHGQTLALFGFVPLKITAVGLVSDRKKARIGDKVKFTADIAFSKIPDRPVRFEYRVEFARPTGKIGRKIFQIGEKKISAKTAHIEWTHSFADLSTRKHFPGKHTVTLIVNGKTVAEAAVNLGPS